MIDTKKGSFNDPTIWRPFLRNQEDGVVDQPYFISMAGLPRSAQRACIQNFEISWVKGVGPLSLDNRKPDAIGPRI